MSKFNTRKWSTPIIIGTGTFVSLSGVLMFLGVHNPLELAHEWIGMAFAAAIFLHILNHWRPFKSYFSQRLTLNIVGAVVLATSAFIATSMTQSGGNPMMSMINSYESSPLTEVAPLLDEDAGGIVAKFEAAGFTVENPNLSIAQIAAANDASSKELMHVLFN
ncbi:MAG: hypothetical protein KZQ90_03205 [Candidatus Thiodiazotropha sp. (ex Codakia rugifera)]|nr:hypothetical protein [Candidatus Thiodiazotropha sp. (ex Codakia rugifera)]